MTNQNAFLGSQDVKFVVRNPSTNKSITVFGQKINPGGSYDLMKIPGITEDDIRSDLIKGSLRRLLSRNVIEVTSSTVNLTSPDAAFSSFLATEGAPTASTNPAYLTQLNWYIDPVNGNDANDGASSGAALKTVAELSRRWGKGNLLSPAGANGVSAVAITVNILGNVPNTDPLNIDVVLDGNVRLVFLGGVASSVPLTVSAVVPRNRATNTPWQFTATGGVTVASRIFDSTVNTYFWVAKDLGSNNFRLSEPCTKPNAGSLIADANQVAISNSDTFAMQTLYTLKLGHIRIGQVRNSAAGAPFGTALIMRDLDLTGDFCPELSTNTSCYIYECKFSKSVANASGIFINLMNCCQPTGQLIRMTSSFTRFYAGLYIGGASAFSPTTSGIQFSNDVIFQSNSLSIVGSNVLSITGAVGIFDSVPGGNGGSNPNGNGLQIGNSAQATIRTTAANAIWGSGNDGYGIGVHPGGVLTLINDAAIPTITGTDGDFSLGGTTSSYGIDVNGAYVGPTPNTWANLLATLGAGTGFGGHAANPQKHAFILKSE